MAIKDRRIYPLKNFRGLDKESPLLKVEPYRASDGFNFSLDNNVLKTRPSFSVIKEPPFVYETGDYLIAFYDYYDAEVYITKKHFYFKIKNTNIAAFNETNTVNLIKGGILPSYDLSSYQPYFQEEKDCLFIFCLDNIYVLSVIRAQSGDFITKVVFYELRSKPVIPTDYVGVDPYEKLFTDLPTPYVPTVILDNKSFEDVNILSNKSYYKFFAAEPTQTKTETKYFLPLYYDEDKHGTFDITNTDRFKVEFYKNRFENYTTYPVYMGVLNQDFLVLNNYGTEIIGTYAGEGAKTDNFAKIIETFYPVKRFRFSGNSINTAILVEGTIGLNKNQFFEMVVEDRGGKTVFEYLMEYIEINKASLTTNKYVVFSLPIQYVAELYDNQDDHITGVYTQQKTINVYIQLKSDEVIEVKINNPKVYSKSLITSDINSSWNNNPAYPDNVAETPTHAALSLSASPIKIYSEDFTNTFINLAQTKILQDETQYSNNDIVRVNGQLYREYVVIANQEVNIPPVDNETGFSFLTSVANTVPTTSNHYPTIDFPPGVAGVPQINLNIIGNIGRGTSFSFSEFSFEYGALQNAISAVIDNHQDLINNVGSAWFRARMYKFMNLNNTTTYYTATVLVLVSYVKTGSNIVTHERRSMVFTCQTTETTTPIENALYKAVYKPDDNIIELTVKNYFYDYKNEPTIIATVSFEKNAEYDYIAKSKFGITFGAENRLFLAGNPDFKHVDRFNVSNDLLGNNDKNQSYELTYFPSKNYRVVGGKGAINGYVIATDTQLYITKEEYPNDARLFIRQRNLTDQGVISYFEYKTNITQTPLNNRCVVRFYNDILILDKEGLYGVEISSNVLTNERLVKLRSGFINNELKAKIAAYDNSKIFITENNINLYIFIGGDVYVADSKYISQNQNSAAENVSYEIVKWIVPLSFSNGFAVDKTIKLIPEQGKYLYGFGNQNYDEVLSLKLTQGEINQSELIAPGNNSFSFQNHTQFTVSDSILPKTKSLSDIGKMKFLFRTNVYKKTAVGTFVNTDQAKAGKDYFINASTKIITILNNSTRFAHLTDGDKLYFYHNNSSFSEITIRNFESSGRTTFTYTETPSFNTSDILFENVINQPLYITNIWWLTAQSTTDGADLTVYFKLSTIKPTEVIKYTRTNNESTNDYKTRIVSAIGSSNYENFYFLNLWETQPSDTILYQDSDINVRWISAITDFGIPNMEKTSFRVNIFATKQVNTNNMTFGYRTLRRLAGLNDVIDLSNNFDLENTSYSQFSLATFNTVAMSLPMKENNFLYIQLIINGNGRIELNGIEILYKANRMIRSVA